MAMLDTYHLKLREAAEHPLSQAAKSYRQHHFLEPTAEERPNDFRVNDAHTRGRNNRVTIYVRRVCQCFLVSVLFLSFAFVSHNYLLLRRPIGAAQYTAPNSFVHCVNLFYLSQPAV